MNDNFYGVQDIRVSTSVDLSKGIVVCPLLSFYFSFFLFFSFFGALNGSLCFSHLSSLGSFDFVLFGIFSSLLGAILYILQEYRRSFTLYKGTHKKKM